MISAPGDRRAGEQPASAPGSASAAAAALGAGCRRGAAAPRLTGLAKPSEARRAPEGERLRERSRVRRGGRPGSPPEGRFRGGEAEEEMLLLFAPSPGSVSTSVGPRPHPLRGEEVVALRARGGCRRPAPTPRPRRALQ